MNTLVEGGSALNWWSFHWENRFNNPLGKLLLDRTVILLQNLRVMFQSLEQSPQSPHTEEIVVS